MNAEKQAEMLIGDLLRETPFTDKVFSVGGFVRDEVMGILSKDLDLVVEEENGAKKVTHLLKSMLKDKVTAPHNLGNGYPIWQLTFLDDIAEFKVKGVILEFADTQKEAFPDPESRQRIATFGSLKEDVLRRDFTSNMLLRNVTSGQLVDFVNGIDDIKNGVLKSHPDVDFNKILNDDPLRMLRMIRFKVKYNWELIPEDIQVAKDNVDRIRIISFERIRDELIKIMEIGKLKEAVLFMDEIGMLEIVLPEVHAMKGVFHDLNAPFHKEGDGDIFLHVMMVLGNAKPTVVQQLGALLHDIGKPPTRTVDPETGKVRFKKHEPIGAIMTEELLRRLKFDSKTIKTVVKIVDMHTRPHAFDRDGVSPSVKAVRKLIREAGDELEELLDLSEADCLGNIPVKNNVPNLRARIEKVKTETPPIAVKAILNGLEIMEALGISQGGPVIGEMSQKLIELEDDFANDGKELTKEVAVEHVKEWNNENV